MQWGAFVLRTTLASEFQVNTTSVLPHRPRSQGLGPRLAVTGEEIADLIEG